MRDGRRPTSESKRQRTLESVPVDVPSIADLEVELKNLTSTSRYHMVAPTRGCNYGAHASPTNAIVELLRSVDVEPLDDPVDTPNGMYMSSKDPPVGEEVRKECFTSQDGANGRVWLECVQCEVLDARRRKVTLALRAEGDNFSAKDFEEALTQELQINSLTLRVQKDGSTVFTNSPMNKKKLEKALARILASLNEPYVSSPGSEHD